MPPRPLRPTRAWRRPSCPRSTTPNISRPFTTTFRSRAIGPEHPHWIDVPQSAQPDKVRLPRIRGSLPVPRDIFHRKRGGVEKVTPAYIAETTKESQKAKPLFTDTSTTEAATEAERQAWKRRMSDRRRQNLREGLLELQTRRQRSIARDIRRKTEIIRSREEAAQAPPSREERLTSSTITALMQPDPGRGFRVPDPNREERVAAMKARVQSREEERKAARVSALQTLYRNARNFIVTEEQLDAAIDWQFGTSERPQMFGWRGTSIWNKSQPEAVQDKLSRRTSARDRDDDDPDEGPHGFKTAKRRMKKLAEELGSA